MKSIDKQPVIYVVGASGRAAAESVRQTGLRAIVLDLYADADSGDQVDLLIVESYPESILDQLSQQPPGWILLAGGMEHYPDLVTSLEEWHRLIGPNVTQLKQLRDLRFLSNSLAKSIKLKFPTTIISDRERLISADNDSIAISSAKKVLRSSEPVWLKKSWRGCGGFHIEEFRGTLPSKEIDFSTSYLQQKLFGRSIGSVFYCRSSQIELLGVVDAISQATHESLVGPQPELPRMAYRGSYGPTEISDELRDAMCEWIRELTRAIDYSGLLQVDWIVDNLDQAWLLEINPRWTASMEIIEWAAQRNLFSIQAGCTEGLREQIGPAIGATLITRSEQKLYKAIVYASSSFDVSSEMFNEMLDRKFQRFNQMHSDPVIESGWSDIPRVGTPIRLGNPLATWLCTD